MKICTSCSVVGTLVRRHIHLSVSSFLFSVPSINQSIKQSSDKHGCRDAWIANWRKYSRDSENNFIIVPFSFHLFMKLPLPLVFLIHWCNLNWNLPLFMCPALYTFLSSDVCTDNIFRKCLSKTVVSDVYDNKLYLCPQLQFLYSSNTLIVKLFSNWSTLDPANYSICPLSKNRIRRDMTYGSTLRILLEYVVYIQQWLTA